MIKRTILTLCCITPSVLAQTDDYTGAQLTLLSSIDSLSNPSVLEYRDGYAYILEDGTQLAIVDVSDPSSITLIGRTPGDLTTSDAITLHQTAAYLRHADGDGFEIIDVSDPSNPTLASSETVFNIVTPLVVANNHIYYNTDRIIDVTDPFNPVPLSNIPSHLSEKFLFGKDNIAFGIQFNRFDVSVPTNPLRIDTGTAFNAVNFIRDSGTNMYGFKSNEPSKLVVNFSYLGDTNSTRPLNIKHTLLTEFTDASLRGSIAFVTADQLDMYLLSSDYFRAARRVASFGDRPALNEPIRVLDLDNYTIILNRSGELAAYSIQTNPISVTPGAYTIFVADRIEIRGNIAFLGATDISAISPSFNTFDISDPHRPRAISQLGFLDISGFSISDTHAYIATIAHGVQIAQIYPDGSLTLIGNIQTNPEPGGFSRTRDTAIKGDTLYATDSERGLHIFDISNPSTPTLVNVVTADHDYRLMSIENDHLYITSRLTGLVDIFDVSDPRSPTLVSTISTDPIELGAQRPTRSGNLLYLPLIQDGFKIFDVSNITNPLEVAHIDTGFTTENGDINGLPYKILVRDDTLFACLSSGGLAIYDNTNPLAPVLKEHIVAELPQSNSEVLFRDIVLEDNLAYIAAGVWGLAIYDLDIPNNRCDADFNGDGQLNFFDIARFLESYINENPAADMNNDGQFNFFDVTAFIVAFQNGCP